MNLSSIAQDVLEEISKFLAIEDLVNLSLVCRALHHAICEDRHLWIFVVDRETGRELSRLPLNAIPIQDASASTLRALVKHAYVLRKAYRHQSTDRVKLRINTPARVTFVKLVRGRWFFVASSDTTVSELSVWEIWSPSDCVLRTRVYFPAPILDGFLDDGGSYLRLAVTVGSCRPSIRILDLARQSDGEVTLVQCTEISDVNRLLYLNGSILFFACLRGDDTWPIMMDWINGGMVRLSYSGGGNMGDPYPLTTEYCSRLHVWRSYIMLFAYSGLHIFEFSEPIPSCSTKKSPIVSLELPGPVFKVTFLDEYTSVDACGHTVTHTRWVSQLDDSETMILVLTYKEDPKPYFSVDVVLSPGTSNMRPNYHFPIDIAIGHAGGHMMWISVDSRNYYDAPMYKLAPIRTPHAVYRAINSNETHLSLEEPTIIPGNGLPFSRSISSLDFDDGHGLLLIGSDAGEFCLLNFAKTLLPDEAITWELPRRTHLKYEDISKTPLGMDIPAYYSYYTLPDYGLEERPTFVINEAIRLWGNVFADHEPIPGWSSDWSKFTYVKDWALPLSLWSTHDFAPRLEQIGHRIRTRLYSFGEITPILYNVKKHNQVILRMGNRVLYCRTILYDEDDEDSGQADILGALNVTYSDFVAADSDTILALINDREARGNLEERCTHSCIERKGQSSKMLTFAVKEAASIGKIPDERTFDEWSKDDWTEMFKKFIKAFYNVNASSYLYQ